MASINNSILQAGRDVIGITGILDGKKITVDLDVTSVFTVDQNVNVPQFPIEKKSGESVTMIDHIIPVEPVISIEAIVSDNLNLFSSIGSSITSLSIQNKAVSVKDKLKYLLYWQRSGSLVKMEGYTTNSTISSKLNVFSRGLSALYTSDLESPYYVGIDTDVIENILIGNIQMKRNPSLGTDVSLVMKLHRVTITETKTTSQRKQQASSKRQSGSSTTSTKTNNGKVVNSAAKNVSK